MADVQIEEISTRVEITDQSAALPADLTRLIEAAVRQMREAILADVIKDQDVRVRDRSWTSDAKSD